MLARFPGRPAIYHHDAFYRKYEMPARANLGAALETFGAPWSLRGALTICGRYV